MWNSENMLDDHHDVLRKSRGPRGCGGDAGDGCTDVGGDGGTPPTTPLDVTDVGSCP